MKSPYLAHLAVFFLVFAGSAFCGDVVEYEYTNIWVWYATPDITCEIAGPSVLRAGESAEYWIEFTDNDSYDQLSKYRTRILH